MSNSTADLAKYNFTCTGSYTTAKCTVFVMVKNGSSYINATGKDIGAFFQRSCITMSPAEPNTTNLIQTNTTVGITSEACYTDLCNSFVPKGVVEIGFNVTEEIIIVNMNRTTTANPASSTGTTGAIGLKNDGSSPATTAAPAGSGTMMMIGIGVGVLLLLVLVGLIVYYKCIKSKGNKRGSGTSGASGASGGGKSGGSNASN